MCWVLRVSATVKIQGWFEQGFTMTGPTSMTRQTIGAETAQTPTRQHSDSGKLTYSHSFILTKIKASNLLMQEQRIILKGFAGAWRVSGFDTARE